MNTKLSPQELELMAGLIKIKPCEACEFGQSKYVSVNNATPVGGSNPKIVVVSGHHLSDDSRKAIGKIFYKRGYTTSDIRYIPLIRCIMGAPGFDDKGKKTLKTCSEYAIAEIFKLAPRGVFCLGDTGSIILGLEGAKKYNGEPMTSDMLPDTVFVCSQKDPMGKLVREDIDTLCDAVDGTYKEKYAAVILEDIEQAERLAAGIIASGKPFSFDFETSILFNDKFAPQSAVLGLGIAYNEAVGLYFPLNHSESNFSEKYPELNRRMVAVIKSLLLSQNEKYAHNAVYDCLVAYSAFDGLRVRNLKADTMLQHHLINPTRGQQSLKYLSSKYFKYGAYDVEIDKIMKSLPVKDRSYGKVPQDVLGKYCAIDAIVCYRLKHLFDEMLDEKGLTYLFETLSMPACELVLDLKLRGFLVDTEKKKEITAYYEDQCVILKHDLRKLSEDVGFNPSSPKQVGQIIYDKYGLPTIKSTASGAPSTDEDTLKKLRGRATGNARKFIDTLLAFRKASKTLGTYLEGLEEHIASDNRIYTDYMIIGTETGRWSSSNPNLANIPADYGVEDGMKIKNIFVAPEGFAFLQADYSQIELRNLANESLDPKLIEVFNNGEDPHMSTAQGIFALPREQITSSMRKLGKTSNFALVYGASEWRLAQTILKDEDLTDEQILLAANAMNIRTGNLKAPLGPKQRERLMLDMCKIIIKKFYETYTRVGEWQEERRTETLNTRIIRTASGRIRTIEQKEQTGGYQAQIENQAVNTPIQGCSADCLVYAMVEINRRLKAGGYESYVIGQVYDSIMAYVKNEEIPEVAKIILEVMKTEPEKHIQREDGSPYFKVKLDVDLEVGPNWGNLMSIKEYYDLIGVDYNE